MINVIIINCHRTKHKYKRSLYEKKALMVPYFFKYVDNCFVFHSNTRLHVRPPPQFYAFICAHKKAQIGAWKSSTNK